MALYVGSASYENKLKMEGCYIPPAVKGILEDSKERKLPSGQCFKHLVTHSVETEADSTQWPGCLVREPEGKNRKTGKRNSGVEVCECTFGSGHKA